MIHVIDLSFVRSGRLVAVLVAGAILLGIAPAVAIETTTFGIDAAERTSDGRLHIEVRAGERTSGKLRIWNKSAEPIQLRLGVVAATVDANGAASLGGDDEAVGWVTVEPDEVTLGGSEEATVDVSVDAPRRLDSETKTVAVVAEPAPVEGAAPPVIERLAITTFLEPDEESLIASLGPFPWIAGVVLLLAVILLARRMNRRVAANSA